MRPIRKKFKPTVKNVFDRPLPANIEINIDVATLILQKAEVRDAMHFASTAGKKALAIIRVLKRESIWKYWMRRDLGLVMDVLKEKLPDWITKNDNMASNEDGVLPKWKLCYVWYRLLIAAYQIDFVNDINTSTKHKIEYKHLNKVQEGNRIRGFNDVHRELYLEIEDEDFGGPNFTIKSINFIFPSKVLEKKYKTIEGRVLNALNAIDYWLKDLLGMNRHEYPVSPEDFPILKNLPRVAVIKHPILVACSYGGATSPGFKCDKLCGAR